MTRKLLPLLILGLLVLGCVHKELVPVILRQKAPACNWKLIDELDTTGREPTPKEMLAVFQCLKMMGTSFDR